MKRDALNAIAERMSPVPASAVAQASPHLREESVAPEGLDAAAFLASGLDGLERQAGEGVPHAVAALALLTEDARLRLPSVAAELSPLPAGPGGSSAVGAAIGLSARLYSRAVAWDGEERQDEALLLLAALAGTEGAEPDGCLGLAVIALRALRFEAAEALAARCLEAETRHPRALCILGLSALEAGSAEKAQTYLAMAARIARTKPDFRADLQAAQRALLLMHLD